MKQKTCDLVYKIIIMLGLGYLAFFSTETILPGVVASAFNINILLLAMLFCVMLLVMKGDKCLESGHKTKKQNWLLLILILFLLFINIIALYKVSVSMLIVYTIIVSIVGRFLFKNL